MQAPGQFVWRDALPHETMSRGHQSPDAVLEHFEVAACPRTAAGADHDIEVELQNFGGRVREKLVKPNSQIE